MDGEEDVSVSCVYWKDGEEDVSVSVLLPSCLHLGSLFLGRPQPVFGLTGPSSDYWMVSFLQPASQSEL